MSESKDPSAEATTYRYLTIRYTLNHTVPIRSAEYLQFVGVG